MDKAQPAGEYGGQHSFGAPPDLSLADVTLSDKADKESGPRDWLYRKGFLQLAGGAYAATAFACPFKKLEEFTIEFWVKTPVKDREQSLIQQSPRQPSGRSSLCSWRVHLNPNGLIVFNVFNEHDQQWDGGVTSRDAINDGNWHHVAVVRTGWTEEDNKRLRNCLKTITREHMKLVSNVDVLRGKTALAVETAVSRLLYQEAFPPDWDSREQSALRHVVSKLMEENFDDLAIALRSAQITKSETQLKAHLERFWKRSATEADLIFETGRIYIDGQLNQEKVSKKERLVLPRAIDGDGVILGRDTRMHDGAFFEGAFDEIRLWNHERTDDDIQVYQNVQLRAPLNDRERQLFSHLTVHWGFDHDDDNGKIIDTAPERLLTVTVTRLTQSADTADDKKPQVQPRTHAVVHPRLSHGGVYSLGSNSNCPVWPYDQLLYFKKVFDTHDTDQDGCVTRDQLLKVMHELGFNPERKIDSSRGKPQVKYTEVEQLVDADGYCDFRELLLAMPQMTMTAEQRCRAALKEFSSRALIAPPADGLIAIDDLHAVLTTLGMRLSQSDFSQLARISRSDEHAGFVDIALLVDILFFRAEPKLD